MYIGTSLKAILPLHRRRGGKNATPTLTLRGDDVWGDMFLVNTAPIEMICAYIYHIDGVRSALTDVRSPLMMTEVMVAAMPMSSSLGGSTAQA